MNGSRAPLWSVVGLFLAMGFCVEWRWHTIGPPPLGRGFEGWLVRSGEAEPLDCDEAAYAYMGRRLLRGDVLYRDLTENKPPLGYWLYALADAVGGPNERTIRLMPIPYILATIATVWWIALRLGGPGAACLSAFVFGVADADPYLFGNGSNMEHFLNLFSVASLALMLRALARTGRWAILGAGACLALATLVKQVAFTHGLVYVLFLMIPRAGRTSLTRMVDVATLALGFAVPWMACVGILIVQGAGWDAYRDIILFARATATDLPPNPGTPPLLVRLIAGNADPQGRLPWPFGTTDYYAWWGAGLWPFWLASLPATSRLLFRVRGASPTPALAFSSKGGGDLSEPSPLPGEDKVGGPSMTAGASRTLARRLLAAWTASAWVQVLLPGQFWQHYYLLPVPGAALAVSLWLADSVGGLRRRPVAGLVVATAILGALVWSFRIQVRDYLARTPDEITSKYKGGAQWVQLRRLGRELASRVDLRDDPRLFVWGWQSPLYLYAGMDAPSRHFFANELLKAHANGDHPLVGPWVVEILRDLRDRPPALVFAGDIPFPALRRFLDERYNRSTLTLSLPDGRGLWVERGRSAEFHGRRGRP